MSDRFSTDWYQQSIIPSDVLEATVKIGVVPEADHAQIWWEVKDPTTSVLLGSGSVHHLSLHQLSVKIEHAISDMVRHMNEAIAPF